MLSAEIIIPALLPVIGSVIQPILAPAPQQPPISISQSTSIATIINKKPVAVSQSGAVSTSPAVSTSSSGSAVVQAPALVSATSSNSYKSPNYIKRIGFIKYLFSR